MPGWPGTRVTQADRIRAGKRDGPLRSLRHDCWLIRLHKDGLDDVEAIGARYVEALTKEYGMWAAEREAYRRTQCGRTK